jgi:hypothetical protein
MHRKEVDVMTTPRDDIAGPRMTRGDLIATIIAVPFCIAAWIWISSVFVEGFTR